MASVVQPTENPIVVSVPSPKRGGRYRVEFPTRAGKRPCGHRTAHARLWLIFLEGGEEAGQEITDTICSSCEPARFARLQAWADALT